MQLSTDVPFQISLCAYSIYRAVQPLPSGEYCWTGMGPCGRRIQFC